MFDRRTFVLAAATLAAMTLTGCGERPAPPNDGNSDGKLRIGIVAKSLGNGFFDAVHKGADEAAASLNAEIFFTGPTTPTVLGPTSRNP